MLLIVFALGFVTGLSCWLFATQIRPWLKRRSDARFKQYLASGGRAADWI